MPLYNWVLLYVSDAPEKILSLSLSLSLSLFLSLIFSSPTASYQESDSPPPQAKKKGRRLLENHLLLPRRPIRRAGFFSSSRRGRRIAAGCSVAPPASSLPSCPMESEKTGGSRRDIAVGPWGGRGGSAWDDGSYTGVREIKLVYGQCIDSIQLTYDRNGKPFQAEKHGGNGGNQTVLVKLKYPEEFLMAVSGHYAPVVRGGSPVIQSLTLKTNQRTLGPFGVGEGTPFSFPIEGGGRIVGFTGRSGWYLDAVGFRLSNSARRSNLLGKVQQRLQRLGTMATKQLGYKSGDHRSQTASSRAGA